MGGIADLFVSGGKSSFDYSSGTKTGADYGTSNETTNLLFDPVTKQALDASLADTSFSKDAAIADSKAAAAFTMQKLLEQQAPTISSNAKASGGYNSTTQDMLNNDLVARTSAAGSTVMLDAISKYQAIKQGNINAASQAVQVTTGKNVSGVKQATSTTQEKKSEVKTVICTELYKQKKISYSEYTADWNYSRSFHPAVFRGYHLWAVPLVRAMARGNKLAKFAGEALGTAWNKNAIGKFSLLGIFLLLVVVPTCFVLGTIFRKYSYLGDSHV